MYGVIGPPRCGLGLRPASQVKARTIRVRDVPRGAGTGYGPDYRTRRDAKIATVPAGLVDGLGFQFRNRHHGLAGLRAALKHTLMALGVPGYAGSEEFLTVNGNRAPLVRRVCMQQCMADVTHLPEVREGEIVGVNLPPLLVSAWVPRVYLREGVPVAVRTITSRVWMTGAGRAETT